MARIEWRNMSLIIISVILAFLLWIYATNERNPVNEQVLTIPLKQSGLSGNLVIMNDLPPSVNIRVQGSGTKVSALTTLDFEAELDLSGVTEGEQSVPVKVTAPSGVQVTLITPRSVTVVADILVEQEIPVAVNFKGSPARGYTALEPVIEPAVVKARGPGSRVAAIAQIKVTADIESAAGPVEQTVPVNPGYKDVVITPQFVKVTVPVAPLPSKTLAVRPVTTGQTAGGYEVSGVTVTPANVQVLAPSAVLQGVRQLETQKIDISGADQDVRVSVGVNTPPGVVEVRPAIVEVTVHVEKSSGPGNGAAQ